MTREKKPPRRGANGGQNQASREHTSAVHRRQGEPHSKRGVQRATGRFVKLPRDILSRTDLTPIAKLTYACIVDAMRKKERSWPGIRTICRNIGVTDKPVLKAIQALEHLGLLNVERRGRGRSSLYSLPDTSAEECRRASDTSGNPSVGESPTLQNSQVSECVRQGVGVRPTEVSERLRPKQTRRSKQTASAASGNSKSPHRELIAYFSTSWSKLIGGGGKYPFSKGQDGVAVKRILKAVNGGLDRACRVVDLYLKDDDLWLTEHGTGRDLSLLASSARLTKYLAETASPSVSAGDTPPEALEHPVIAEARKRWADDVAEHSGEYKRVVEAVESGKVPATVVKRSKAKTGADFRRDVQQEVTAHAG